MMSTVEGSSLSHRSSQGRPVHVMEFPRVSAHFFERTCTCLFDKCLYPFRNSFLKKLPKGSFARAELLAVGWDELLKLPPNALALDGSRLRILSLRLDRSQRSGDLFTEEV